MKISSTADWTALKSQLRAKEPQEQKKILVCCGTGCRAGGSLEIAQALTDALQAKVPAGKATVHTQQDCQGMCEPHATWLVKKPGCQGMCEKGPLLWLLPQGIFYCSVKVKDVPEIIEKTIAKGEIIERLLYKDPQTKARYSHHDEIPFIARQHRLILHNMGALDPGDIEDYIRMGGYDTLVHALLTEKKPESILEKIEKSTLRGRGGAGFLTGRKWRSCYKAKGNRYILCNGDEGDPGAFMDRSIMEGDPHAVLEGMILGAYAIDAHHGYIYVRHEYPLAVKHLTLALQQAREYGLLGENILGSGFSFDLQIVRGGGAFVCGESSALMRSIEGKVGEPRAKYVHATEKGLFDEPTVLNNVETWANVPLILKNGPAWFQSIGTEKSKGTKVFALVGKVKNTGLIEVAMGTTLREVIFGIGGGVIDDRPFKAVQTGGPSGGCLPASSLDLPVDYDTLTAAGSMMGSGGMIVMDDRTCMVDVARYFTQFLIEESCGKCIPCREGLPQILHILKDITLGKGTTESLAKIEELAFLLENSALCGLGISAANPVTSTLRYFREEYLQHIIEKRCPAGVCKALTSFHIEEKCVGCTACAKVCPVEAIRGEKKQRHEILQPVCIQCGSCFSVCKFNAISIGKRS